MKQNWTPRKKKKGKNINSKEQSSKGTKKLLPVKTHLKCSICNLQQSNLFCDGCHNVYPSKCITKFHQHIPDLEDNDQFLWHQCYREDSNDRSTSEDSLDAGVDTNIVFGKYWGSNGRIYLQESCREYVRK